MVRNLLKHYAIQGVLRKEARKLKDIIDSSPGIIDSFVARLNNSKIEETTLGQMPVIIAYTLIQWALDGKKQGKGYGFPFDRPYLVFYQSLQIIYCKSEKLQELFPPDLSKRNNPFREICKLLKDTLLNVDLNTNIFCMQDKVIVFDKLRKAMLLPMSNKASVSMTMVVILIPGRLKMPLLISETLSLTISI